MEKTKKKHLERLTKDFLSENEKLYYALLLKDNFEEFNNGYKMEKFYKASSQGTKIKYNLIENDEENEEVKSCLIAQVQEFNQKYGSNLKISFD